MTEVVRERRRAEVGVSWDVARELAHAAATPLRPTSLRLSDAGGTVLATPLVAPSAVPPVDRSAMDGYAVRGAGPWSVVGSVLAGSGLAPALRDGEARTIVTGAAIPPGTSAVLPDEHARLTGTHLTGEVEAGRHIRRAGEECTAGELLLPAGIPVNPPVLGLAAAVGLDRLTVIPQPRVLALITGDELIHHGPSAPGQTRDAIGPILPGLLTAAGASPPTPHPGSTTPHRTQPGSTPHTTPHDTQPASTPHTPHHTQPDDTPQTAPHRTQPGSTPHPTPPGTFPGSAVPSASHPLATDARSASGFVVHLPDSRAALVEAISSADSDLILVSGSSAAGPADHLRGALAELGAELIVDGVACRPGHPQALARLGDGRLVVGLPGNPFAALAAFLTLGVAALRRLRGLPLEPLTVAPVPGGITCHPTSTRLVPVRVTPQGAVPVGHAGSAMLRGAAGADALAIVEPGPAEAIAARLLPLDPGAQPWAV